MEELETRSDSSRAELDQVQTAYQLNHGALHIRLLEGSCFIGGMRVWLQPKQFFLLACLMASRGEPVSGEQLWTNVFGTARHNTGSHLRRQIMELRRRLTPFSVSIDTTAKGYRLRVE